MCTPTRTWLGWIKEIHQAKHSTGQGLAASGAWFLFPLQAYASSLLRVQNPPIEEAVDQPALPNQRFCGQPLSSTGSRGGGLFLGFIHRFPGCPIHSRAGARAVFLHRLCSSQLDQHFEKETHYLNKFCLELCCFAQDVLQGICRNTDARTIWKIRKG